jgi:Domain of unknown function (DUF1906)
MVGATTVPVDPIERIETLQSYHLVQMTRAGWSILCVFLVVALWPLTARAADTSSRAKSYLGFDRNEYPGDALLPGLRKTFSYSGYWLNVPPGASSNSWTGKRAILRAQGFGFLVLFNGRLDDELKGRNAADLGRSDAQAAVSSATKAGFPAGTLIFLDQEQGGRLLPEQRSYLFSWIDAIRNLSRYRAGVYCSGIEVPDGPGRISTAEDILNTSKDIRPSDLWVFDDECPPSPGCVVPSEVPPPSLSGVEHALVWQYTQSPRRPQFTSRCAKTYATDNNCYAPGLPHSGQSYLDFDVSTSADPSSGR